MISAATVGAGGVVAPRDSHAIAATTPTPTSTARRRKSLCLNDLQRASTSASPPFGWCALSTVLRVSPQARPSIRYCAVSDRGLALDYGALSRINFNAAASASSADALTSG